MLTKQQKSAKISFQDLGDFDDQTLNEKHAYHEAFYARAPKILFWSVVSAFIGFFGGVFLITQGFDIIGGLSLCASLPFLLYSFQRDINSLDHVQMAHLTLPLSEADPKFCLSAIEAAKNCPDARIWRDQVIEKSRALRVFDYQLMQNLYEEQQSQEANRDHHSKCLELHGFPS